MLQVDSEVGGEPVVRGTAAVLGRLPDGAGRGQGV